MPREGGNKGELERRAAEWYVHNRAHGATVSTRRFFYARTRNVKFPKHEWELKFKASSPTSAPETRTDTANPKLRGR